jgi:hypothetical protein
MFSFTPRGTASNITEQEEAGLKVKVNRLSVQGIELRSFTPNLASTVTKIPAVVWRYKPEGRGFDTRGGELF